MSINCKEMVVEYLKSHKYDGLFSDDCACEINDLMPCGSVDAVDCEAGYKVVGCTCGEGCDQHIVQGKQTID